MPCVCKHRAFYRGEKYGRSNSTSGVADATFKRLNIKNLPLYYAGNVAPDCIHSRKNYQREMKKHTHLRDGISDWDFILPENLKLFQKRLGKFQKEYCNKGDNQELYLGYLTHLITDEMFMRTIRLRCAEEAEKSGILQTDKSFFGYMMREVNGADTLAAKNINFINDPVEMMKKSYGCYLRDYITANEMKDGMEWIIDYFFSDKNNFEEPAFLTMQMIEDFIQIAVNEIYKRIN